MFVRYGLLFVSLTFVDFNLWPQAFHSEVNLEGWPGWERLAGKARWIIARPPCCFLTRKQGILLSSTPDPQFGWAGNLLSGRRAKDLILRPQANNSFAVDTQASLNKNRSILQLFGVSLFLRTWDRWDNHTLRGSACSLGLWCREPRGCGGVCFNDEHNYTEVVSCLYTKSEEVLHDGLSLPKAGVFIGGFNGDIFCYPRWNFPIATSRDKTCGGGEGNQQSADKSSSILQDYYIQFK